MEKMKVEELMRSIDEFPRISSQATFMEAVEALEKADLEFKAAAQFLREYSWFMMRQAILLGNYPP